MRSHRLPKIPSSLIDSGKDLRELNVNRLFSEDSQYNDSAMMSTSRLVHLTSRANEIELKPLEDPIAERFRMGAGIGDKCSGGWTSNRNLTRLQRLEKLRVLANPELSVSWQQVQADWTKEAEGQIEVNLNQINAKKRKYANIGKLRAQKGIKELKDRLVEEIGEIKKSQRRKKLVQLALDGATLSPTIGTTINE